MENKWYAYILTCNDNTLYSGSTNNIEKRVHEHNTSKSGAHYTKIRRPVSLSYYEVFETYKEARSREAAFKRMKRSEKEALLQKP